MMTSALILALTLWLEARGEGMQGMHYVASVIHNRMEDNKGSIKLTVLKPKQFSCWNDKAPNDFVGNLPNDSEWELAKVIAGQLARGEFRPSIPATHYYNPDHAEPSWAKDMEVVKVHKRHIFLKEK